jgi:hypothetical protein
MSFECDDPAKALRTRGKRHAVQSADVAQALGWPLIAGNKRQASCRHDQLRR